MNYKIYYLNFTTPVHFGNGNLSDADYVIYADTLFSALCIEAMKQGGEEKLKSLVDAVKKNRLRISDCMPHIGKELWIPKPFLQVKKDREGDSIVKKGYKKLSYIPLTSLDVYLQGNLQPEELCARLHTLGKSDLQTKASLREKEALPYHIGTYTFRRGNGLYIIAGYEKEEEYILDELMKGLSYVGIGGKISSGYGKFELDMDCLDETIQCKLQGKEGKKMTLSISLPQEMELDNVIHTAQYRLIKRSGFIQSYTYDDTARKRKDLYMIQSGSCFMQAYEGDIYDVSHYGKHPVYKYGKPMFLEVEV